MKIRDVADDQLWWDSRSGEDRARTQALKDQLPDYTTRDLSTVARRVMVLNEIAASRGRGYFLHLPANAALTSFPSTARLPEERRIQHVKCAFQYRRKRGVETDKSPAPSASTWPLQTLSGTPRAVADTVAIRSEHACYEVAR